MEVKDIQAIVEVLRGEGLENDRIAYVISSYPPIIAYDERRLRELFDYLRGELGIDAERVVTSAANRPSIFGLTVDGNLRKMVAWLQRNGYSHEEVVHFVLNTL